MPYWSEFASALFWFIYSCAFEWILHRYFMHAPRFPLQDAFRGHMAHHKTFRGDERFQAEPHTHPGGVALRWYAFPLMMLGHAPVWLVIQHFLGVPIFWGALAGCSVYFAGYEYTHYLMHVPQGHYVERFAWFRFIREHHRLHHQYMRCNYNVFIPLADLCFGTFRAKG